jgi:hypothetical protein
MATQTLDLWTLVRTRPQIDPGDLADAVREQAKEADLDYRTRLLIRDSVEALKSYWGTKRVAVWLADSQEAARIESICREPFDKVGFPSLRRRLMDKTEPETIQQFLRDLGRRLKGQHRVYVAGSVALILPGFLTRHTEDIDVVGEVPKEIRDDHAMVDALQELYGLHLGHVQPHYYPKGWLDRSHSLASYGRLQVFLLDVYDVFLSKLFSVRDKDMGDMRVLMPQLNKDTLVRKFKETAGDFLASQREKESATVNWKILFGEDLPT